MALAACRAPAPDATGEETYRQLCRSCHGEDLAGGVGPALGPGSNASEQDDEFLELTIMRGRGRMPAFGSSLGADQLDRLIGFIRERQR
jgi:mono/diheme cytochrome c family protein